jgi:hypothetical protein
MLRQRLTTRESPAAFVGKLLVLLFGAALVWYGLMLALLALKVAPATINSISGYRGAYDALTGISPADITGTTRGIVAVAGVLAFLLFGYLALRALPRPYLVRHDLELDAGPRGDTIVAPRAVERLAESAALGHASVVGAAGRYGTDELSLSVSVGRARGLADALTEIHERVLRAFDDHDLPRMPVRVTLTGFDPPSERELN